MGQCLCKDRQRRQDSAATERSSSNSVSDGIFTGNYGSGRNSSSHHRYAHLHSSSGQRGHDRAHTLGLDVRDLILETLNVIRTLVNKLEKLYIHTYPNFW